MPAASLYALLAHSIDYAGMFPPCSLDLESASHNQAQYVRSPDAWMLNSFVLPIDQFEAAAPNLSLFDKKHALRVSALGAKDADLKNALEAIRDFARQHVDVVSVVQLEMPLATDVDLAWLREAGATVGDLKLHVFWEAPPDAAEETIGLLAQLKEPRFGYKLRTGGVSADMFPSAVQIAEALVAATKHHVPIKFTAGLHHPIRQFRDEVGTQMHGFLNVLGAGVLASEHHWDEGQVVQMLEDERPASFSFDETIFAWREWEITAERIHARRKYVTSFGSCSFDDPRDDLRAVGLL
ncbi:MAG TPA: hypothetical protein VFO30_06975 [Chthoniobacterales bacterium]|nr:hypothetical protein [Chthoniobacterales bacterium]